MTSLIRWFCRRSHAIACVNQFIISRTEVLMLHIDSFIEVCDCPCFTSQLTPCCWCRPFFGSSKLCHMSDAWSCRERALNLLSERSALSHLLSGTGCRSMLLTLTSYLLSNKKAQLSLTNPRDAKPAKIAPIRRAYNVVANNTGLSSCV